MMSVYQPAPGQNSTTVMPGLRPHQVRVSTGWRQGSRARSAGRRQSPATASAIVWGPPLTGMAAGSAAFGFGLQPARASAAAPVRTSRLDAPDDSERMECSDNAAPAP